MRQLRLALLVLSCLTLPLRAQNRPLDPKLDSLFPDHSDGFVTDVAKLLKNRAALETTLRNFRDSDSLYINVVTLPTIGDRAVEDVAREIGRKWRVAYAGVGSGPGANTGFVVLIAMAPTHKCRVEVARGSEGYVTDSKAADACRAARQALHDGDFDAGIGSIVQTLADAHHAEVLSLKSAQTPTAPSDPIDWGAVAGVVLLVGGVIGLIAFWFYRKEQKRIAAEAAARAAEAARRAAQWERDRPRREAAERAAREEAARQAAAARERARLAAEAEKARWNALTPAQQQAELAAKAAAAVAAAKALELERLAAAQREEEARARRRREEEEEASRRSSYSSSSDSSSSWGSSDSGSSGGSGGFDGGGGGSDF